MVRSLLRLLQPLCLLGALWYILAFIVIAAISITYPFNLEWMEGQTIDIVQRIVEGKPFYTAPTVEYVPFIYTPLYYYASAFVSYFTGIDFFAARLVSTLSALGAGGIIGAWVIKEGGNWRSALVAAGLFFATYEQSSRWFDVARVDSFFIFLTLAGLFVFYHYRGLCADILAAALFTAAFFTKQSGLVIAMAALFGGVLLDRRFRALSLYIAFMVITIGIANVVSDAWFKYYVFTLPSGHRIDRHFILAFWKDDMLRWQGPLLLMAALGAWSMLRTSPRKALGYIIIIGGCILSAYFGRLHRYGWTNVLIPAHAALALFAGLSLVYWAHRGKVKSYYLGLVLVAAQMGILAYNPMNDIPDKEAIAEGNAFLDKVASIEGEVFMPELQFVQTRVGKKSYAYGMASVDIWQTAAPDPFHARTKLGTDIADAIRTQRFSAIITSGLIPIPFLHEYYRQGEKIGYPRKYVSGFRSTRPMSIHYPKRLGPPRE